MIKIFHSIATKRNNISIEITIKMDIWPRTPRAFNLCSEFAQQNIVRIKYLFANCWHFN